MSIQSEFEALKRNRYVMFALLALAILFIIWLLLRKYRGNITQTTPITNIVANLPGFSVPGFNYTFNRPLDGYQAASYNLGSPNTGLTGAGWIIPGPPCGCGCVDGCGGSNTDYSFPDLAALLGYSSAKTTGDENLPILYYNTPSHVV